MDKNHKIFWTLAILAISFTDIILVPPLNEALIGHIFMPAPFIILSFLGIWLAWRLHHKTKKTNKKSLCSLLPILRF